LLIQVKIRTRILFFVLMIACIDLSAQYSGNTHNRLFSVVSDTIQLDTLSLIPNSIQIKTKNGALLDTSFYKINYADGILILNRSKIKSSDSLIASYKTFPYLFSAEVKHKDANRIKPDLFGNKNPFDYDVEEKNDNIFKTEGLNKSGSISRGISFGNNQDMTVNSNLNLQLSGHLSNNVDILMAATDNNIPIQPEGNTQQLQEFDKVFIQLSNANSKLIAGDFQLSRPTGYFMNFNKKAQGISFSTIQKVNAEDKDMKKQGVYKTTLSAAVSRGKFARNQIQGVESNQGPYRLRGAENEPFIIVLSGTEKVYIDGRLMDRGQENDYVINYNTAEITFTARQLITKDKRIVVEFQYSDKNYARSLIHFANDYEQDKLKVHFNIYSEQDSKNQPLQQELSPEQKKLLSQIGDTLSLAITPSIDSVAFTNSEVLYQRNDTTIGTHVFKKIFLYSPTKIYVSNGVTDSAHFRVTYSNVGAGNGNYNQIVSSANGKVFQWVIPDTTNGFLKPRGSYEPVIQLVTPKQKQMLTAGVDYAFSANTKLSIEGAMTKNDINTFSPADSKDDKGYAFKMNLDNIQPLFKAKLNDTTASLVTLATSVNYEYVQKYFSPIERYRSIEFERDWNRGSVAVADDQHIVGASAALTKKDMGTVGYKFNALFEGAKYNANKNIVTLNFTKKGFNVMYNASLLNSASVTNTNFYRHSSGVSQKIKIFTVGLKDEFEQNKFSLHKKDSLLANSYKFWEWQAYIQNADTTKNRYGINYKQRTDHVIKNTISSNAFNQSTFAESYGGFYELLQNPNNQLKLNAAYRRMKVDSTLTSQKPDNSLVARLEYNLRLWKGVFFSGTFYEIGSGLEVKKEFQYVEVAAGQGVYTWNDYNGNGVKELNEFEVAAFRDQATYIKVYTPTSDYIKTYSNQFSENIMLKPAAVWATKSGFRKFVARFANQAAYRVDRKSTESALAKAYNPFLGLINDTLLNDDKLITVNSSFRNTLYFNQLSSVFGLDVSYQDVRNKILYVNGFDTRQNIFREGHLRWNMSQQFSQIISYKDGRKSSLSQYFGTRNYSIRYYEVEPKFSYQPNTAFRTTVSYKYTDKKNAGEFGGQRATIQDYGAEVKYNVLEKGSLNLKADYIQITFDGSSNTSLSFEMLDALKTGKNVTWGLTYQRNLSSNLQLSVTYDGRKSESSKAIHTAGVQVRAYF
jgi:hypothetical protein